MRTFAQNYEDLLLWRIFRGKTDGFYVDVGAHDPDELSVTKYFYLNGWSGINIEPLPEKHKLFEAARERDINLNLAIATETGFLPLYTMEGKLPSGLDAGALASFVKEEVMPVSEKHDMPIVEIEVKTDSLKNVLERHLPEDQHIDFLKVDVEGFELQVVKSADFSRFRPTVLVLEATKPNSNPVLVDDPEEIGTWHTFEPLIVDAGYEFVYFDGLNRYYLAAEAAELKPLFSFSIGVYDGLVPRSLYKVIDELRATGKNLRKKVVMYRTQCEEYHVEIEEKEAIVEQLKEELESTKAELEQMKTALDQCES